MNNAKKCFNLLLLLTIPTIFIATNAFYFNFVYAALNQEHVNQLREMLKGISNNLQSNSTVNASNTLNTIINNITKSICKGAICPTDSLSSSEQADLARTPLKEALKSIQSGNMTAVQNQLTNANSTLNELLK